MSQRTRALGADAPRSRALSAALVVLLFLLAVLWRPLVYGADPIDVVRVLGFLAAFVFGPGCLAWAALRPRSDALTLLGMGGALGLALQGIARVGLGIAGIPSTFVAWPLVCLPLFWLARRRRQSGAQADPGAPLRLIHGCWIALAVILSVERTRLHPAWWADRSADLFFHAGNAAEFAHHWPLESPRTSGLPLTYHFFSYALPAGCSQVTGIPIHELYLRLLNGFVPALLVVQITAVARLLRVPARGAILAAFLIVLHADVGRAWRALLGSSDGARAFNSLLDAGVFSSPPTVMSLVFFLALAVPLARWLDAEGRGGRSDLALAALIGAVASATKGSVMPVVIGGLGLLGLVALVRRQPIARIGIACAVLACAAAPMTAWLTFGPESYATAMFRVAPGEVLFQGTRSGGGFLPGDAPAWLATLLAPAWIAGYLGPVAPACLAALRRSTGLSPGVQGWLLSTGACSLVLALVLAAPGVSELFFAYTGQIGLIVVAAAGLAGGPTPRRFADRALPVVSWLLVALMAVGAARTYELEIRRDLGPHPAARRDVALYAQGLDWIRVSSPKDCVIVSRPDAMIVSVLAERRTLFETGLYSAASHRLATSPEKAGDPGIERIARLLAGKRDVFREPTAAHLRAVRDLAHGSRDVLFLWDGFGYSSERGLSDSFEFRACGDPPAEARDFLGAPLFENETMHVYKIPPELER